MLASFPRSGNTWIRFIIANAIRYEIDGPEVDFNTLAGYVPDLPYHIPTKGALASASHRLVLKTHYPYLPAYKNWPVLLVVREPAAALLSLSENLAQEHSKRIDPDKMVFGMRSGAVAWREFHRSWLKRDPVLVNYDDLVVDAFNALQSALPQSGILLSDKALRFGVENSSREKMRELRLQRGDPNARGTAFDFVRTAESDRNKVLSQRSLDYIEAICSPVFSEMRYVLAR